MGITVTTKRFATPTSTGEVTWTDTNLGGLTPKAIMIITNHADTDGTAEAGMADGIGFADATREAWIGNSSKDAVTTSLVSHDTDTANVIGTIVDSTVQVVANFVSFGVNSVTLDFTTVDSDAQLYTVVFFAGSDLSVYADLVAVSSGAEDITAPSFEPDLVLAIGTFNAGGPAAHYIGGFGVCWNDESDTQRGVGIGLQDALATSKTASILNTSNVINGLLNDVNFYTASIGTFDANGFTVTTSSANTIFSYLALNFGGAASVSVRSFDSPTGTGEDARTGVGFKPQFVMIGMTDAQANDEVEGDADGGSWGISVFTPDAEFSNSWADEDDQGTTDTQSLANDQAIDFASGDGVTQHAATFVSMDADGHTLNYSVADGTARKWFEVTIGAVSVIFTSANFALHHSGASDIGGAIGAELTDDALNNLWDDVSSADADAGDTEYRCTYVKNTHGSLSIANVKVEIDTDPAESNFEIALGAAGKNGTETAIADEDTAPSGPSFGTTPITIGTLAAGDFYPIWIKRIVSAGAEAATPDTGVLRISGNDPN